jgi:hypothetical protein
MDGWTQACRQCGKQKDDNGFVICGACLDANVEYQKKIDESRPRLMAVGQEWPLTSQRGYHGYNYSDDELFG